MADILYDFPIAALAAKVFGAISMPEGLDAWWTLRSAGKPALKSEFQLYFGPQYDWRAVVSCCELNAEFEFQMTKSMPEWEGTRVGFHLTQHDETTHVRFHHLGWPQASDHFRTTAFCWAMYLRLLKRYVEHGGIVPYDRRLDV